MEIDNIKSFGNVSIKIENVLTNEIKKIEIKNAVLNTGTQALANCLANKIDGSFSFYVNRMLFGDGGTTNSVPKHVSKERTGLFGITRAIKPVIATIDPNLLSKVNFTTILGTEEANGYNINEIALQMSNGDLYSMATFADLNKTSSIQITFNWQITIL
jgi:hypothetical protein